LDEVPRSAQHACGTESNAVSNDFVNVLLDVIPLDSFPKPYRLLSMFRFRPCP
jgi:hypothetical protein